MSLSCGMSGTEIILMKTIPQLWCECQFICQAELETRCWVLVCNPYNNIAKGQFLKVPRLLSRRGGIKTDLSGSQTCFPPRGLHSYKIDPG